MKAVRLFPLVIGCAGAMLAVDQFVEDHLASLRSARSIFVEAVSSTRAKLVAGAWQVAADESLWNQFEQKNYNTVAQSLQSFVRSGEIAQIEFVDSDCNLIVRSPSGAKPLAGVCKTGAVVTPGLTWQKSSSGLPVLSMILPKTIGTTNLAVIAHVELDQAWVSVFGELSNLISSRSFSLFEDSSHGLVWREGFTQKGLESEQWLVSLRVGGWISSLLPNFMKYSLTSYQASRWLSFSVLGFFGFFVYFESLIHQRKLSEAKTKLCRWTYDRREKLCLKEEDQPRAEDPWQDVIHTVTTLIDGYHERLRTQIKLLNDRQTKLSGSVVDREKQIAELKDLLAGMSDLASLKEQLQHSTGSFLTRMQDVREVCETIFDLASEGIAKQGKALHEFALRWKQGVDDPAHPERGARKFFRTLSETPGRSAHTSRLDDELFELHELTSRALDQALHLAMLSRQALSDVESGVQLAGVWHGLAMHGAERERTCDWVECLKAAQYMVVSDVRYATLAFEKLPQFSSFEDIYPSVPRPALVSGMFHLYMALLADVSIEVISLPIILRQKHMGSQGTMIFSLPQNAEDIADAAPLRSQNYHMDLARAILAPLGIRVAFLPPTIAGVPVALSWNLPNKQVDVDAQSSAGTSVREQEVTLHQ